MKNALLHLAVTVAVTTAFSGMASAAPEDIKYELYGKVHVSADAMDDGDDSSLYLSSNSSRLGFKGDKAINDDLMLIWQIESEVNFDEGGKILASRDTYAGIEGGLGQLIAGRHDSPIKMLAEVPEVFRDAIGDLRSIISGSKEVMDKRLDNLIMYTTPSFAGLEAKAGYAVADGPDDDDTASATVVYKTDSLTLAAGYEVHGKNTTPVDTDGDGETDSPSAENENGIRIAGAYSIGDLTAGAIYEIMESVAGTDGADVESFGVSAVYKLGDTKLKAQYSQSEGLDTMTDAGSSMIAVGASRQVADKLEVYLTYSSIDNEANASSSVSVAGRNDKLSVAAGDDPSAISLGAIYKF